MTVRPACWTVSNSLRATFARTSAADPPRGLTSTYLRSVRRARIFSIISQAAGSGLSMFVIP
jgi:hypothetical protein